MVQNGGWNTVLKINECMTRERINLAIEAALLLGFQTESTHFPIAGKNGEVEIPVSWDELKGLWKLELKKAAEDYQEAKPAGDLFNLDFRKKKGLETIFGVGRFFEDNNYDFLPDKMNVKIVLPEEADQSVVIAACNIAFRLGMETTSYRGGLLESCEYEGNCFVFENKGDAKLTFEETGQYMKVHVWGTGTELEKFSALLCENFPKVDAWRTWRDALLDMSEDFAMKNPDGQLAYLKAFKSEDASYEAYVSPEMKPEQEKRFDGISFHNYKAGKTVYQKEYDIPWEVDVFRKLLQEKLYGRLNTGDKVKILAALSEDEKIRGEEAQRICEEVQKTGAEAEKIDIICAYKQGFSWISEKIVPCLKDKKVDKFEIYFKPFLPEGQTDWMDENGATPKRVRLVENTPDKWFDLPIRYLQELYPIEDIIVRELGIDREQVIFKAYEGDEELTYLCKAYGDGEIYESSYLAVCSERPQMDEYPQLGKVHPASGFVKVWINNELVLNERVKTDLEAVWDIYQAEVLPDCKDYIMKKTKGNISPELQPFFQKLHLDITLSEPEYRIGSREDLFSPMNALHEDLYFTGSDYFKYLGQMNNAVIDAPGLILPDLHVAEGKPRFKVTLYEPLKDHACIVKNGQVLCEEKKRTDVQAWVSEVSMEENSLSVKIQTEGVCDEVLEAYAELYTEGILQISKTIGCFGKLYLSGKNTYETACQLEQNSDKSKCIEDINLHEFEVISYETYLEIIEELKEVDGIEVFRTAVSYAGRECYGIWLKPKYEGYLSMTKYLTNRPSEYINARHHANEVSSTNAAFILLRKLLTDKSYENLTEKLNLIIVPMENVDGAAIHYELQKENPYWSLHVARFNSIGKEFCYEYYQADVLNTEALTATRIYEKYIPDIMVDNHGVPSHEWEQQFSGYTSPAYKGFWLPRSLLYGYFWYITNPEFSQNIPVNKRMEDVVADKIAEDAEMRRWNQEWSAQFEKYAHAWMPLLFPADYYKEMINYWVPYALAPKNIYAANRYPWITTVSYTSEVADETAQDEYINLCARAHVAHDEAIIKMLMEATCNYSYGMECVDGKVFAEYYRQRPIIV